MEKFENSWKNFFKGINKEKCNFCGNLNEIWKVNHKIMRQLYIVILKTTLLKMQTSCCLMRYLWVDNFFVRWTFARREMPKILYFKIGHYFKRDCQEILRHEWVKTLDKDMITPESTILNCRNFEIKAHCKILIRNFQMCSNKSKAI